MPGILGSLTDARTLNDSLVLLHVLSLVTIALHVLAMNVPLNLILAKPQWQIEFKGLVVLTGLRFLEARVVGVSRGTRATLCRPTRIL